MKYGVVRMQDWTPRFEGYPDDSFCIAVLTDNGNVALDQYANSDVACGVGSVYTVSAPHIRLAVHLLPLDLIVNGMFETEGEAIDHAIDILNNYANDNEAREAQVSREIHRRRNEDVFIDNTIQYQRGRRLLVFGILIGVIFILILLFILFTRRMHNEVPTIPGTAYMLHSLWASITHSATAG